MRRLFGFRDSDPNKPLDQEDYRGMSYNGILEQIYGLPVYRSKWDPDTMIVMGNRGGKTLAQQGWEYAQEMADRPYKGLTDRELDAVLAQKLADGRPDPIEVTAFGDTKRTFIVPDNYTYQLVTNNTSTITTSPYLSNSTTLWTGPLFTQPQPALETIFRVGSDGQPEAVSKLVSKPSEGSIRNETDMAWLKRRVAEVCWIPA